MNMFRVIFSALRTGQSVKNESRWKYAGMVALLGSIALSAAQSRGWLTGIEADDWVDALLIGAELFGYTFGFWTIPATTQKIGVDDIAKYIPVRRIRPPTSRMPVQADNDEADGSSSSSRRTGDGGGPFNLY